VEKLLDEPQLAVAADEGRLEGGRSRRAAAKPDHSDRLPQLEWLRLALESVRTRVLEDDRRLGGALCRFPDEHAPGLGFRLDAGRGVDQISCNHALSLCAESHGRFARQDTGTCPELGCSHLRAERANAVHEVESCSNSPLGVVLAGDRSSPKRHDRVADELLHSAPVPLDHRSRCVEVAGEEFPSLLGVAAL